MDSFKCEPGFCNYCGSILPLFSKEGHITCYTCKRIFGPEAFGKMEGNFTLHFNTFNPTDIENTEEERAEGPIVDRKCSKCGHDKMSYATLQLRSADEGQTVFFTCLKCKFKETENS